jgi:hypothetical protein
MENLKLSLLHGMTYSVEVHLRYRGGGRGGRGGGHEKGGELLERYIFLFFRAIYSSWHWQ